MDAGCSAPSASARVHRARRHGKSKANFVNHNLTLLHVGSVGLKVASHGVFLAYASPRAGRWWTASSTSPPAGPRTASVALVLAFPAKNEAGLDHYQVWDWRAWHAHVTLAMLAAAYLAATRAAEHHHAAEKGDRQPVPTP
jgi:hypothetical protein